MTRKGCLPVFSYWGVTQRVRQRFLWYSQDFAKDWLKTTNSLAPALSSTRSVLSSNQFRTLPYLLILVASQTDGLGGRTGQAGLFAVVGDARSLCQATESNEQLSGEHPQPGLLSVNSRGSGGYSPPFIA